MIEIFEDLCARSRYQGQGQVITSHRYCGMQLLNHALDNCFWHTRPRICEKQNPHISLAIVLLCTFQSNTSMLVTGLYWKDSMMPGKHFVNHQNCSHFRLVTTMVTELSSAPFLEKGRIARIFLVLWSFFYKFLFYREFLWDWFSFIY